MKHGVGRNTLLVIALLALKRPATANIPRVPALAFATGKSIWPTCLNEMFFASFLIWKLGLER